MIPAPFEYHLAESVEDAIAALADGGEDAKLLAGGHSLLPLMKLRLAAPTKLVDISRLDELRGIEVNGGLRIGGGTRHAELQVRDDIGVVAHAASLIADQQVRNRGTIGGSIAHADPASDLPTVLLAADGSVEAQGGSGSRTIAAADIFLDYLTTSLSEDEVITAVTMPSMEGWDFGYEKFNRRSEDWAMVGVCALVKKGSDGSCEDVRIGLTHMGSTPLRASTTEDALRGGALDAESIAAAAEQAADGTDPPGDLNATPDYKRHLARTLVKRALEQAAGI